MSKSTMPVSDKPIYVLVFAHPDDESMFFLPTVKWLVDSGNQVWFLCLTTGNYDGLGKLRETELEKAGNLLGASKVIVRNDAEILDHPTKRYGKETVARAIRESLSKHNTTKHSIVLVTFDEGGVSGHVNHIDVYHGVVHLMAQDPNLYEVWCLESERNLMAKYIPIISWILLLLSCIATSLVSYSWSNDNNSNTRMVRMHNPLLNWKAMATHHSQFVWYRRLFVVFSCYTYYNKLIIHRKGQ